MINSMSTFYIVGALVLLAFAIILYPTLKKRANKS